MGDHDSHSWLPGDRRLGLETFTVRCLQRQRLRHGIVHNVTLAPWPVRPRRESAKVGLACVLVASAWEASTVAIRTAERTAELSDAPLIIGFLNDVASQREFFPVYSLDELQSGAGRLHGLSIDSVLIAEVDGRLVGALALWDQRSFK